MGGIGRILAGLVTLAVLAAGGIYLLDLLETGNFEQGTVRLNVRFDDAHGVTAGGVVRHKGVQVGEVLRVDVAPDDSAVILELAVRGRFAHTLRRSSRFWIVRPRFGGLTQGIRGLDTLIKDPYVEYDTPDLGAPLLSTGSVVYGMNAAPAAEEGLFHRKGSGRPSVTFTVRFPRSHGLSEGAPVLYRDLTVGKVLGVDLSMDGRSVEARVLVEGRFRDTVRRDTLFWVARPSVEVGFFWPRLVSVQDLSTLLTGAALAYATPTDSRSPPVETGVVLEGTARPPEDLEEKYQGPLAAVDRGKEVGRDAGPVLPEAEVVGVTFACTDEDLFRDDRVFLQGTGLLFRGADGEARVLTARTLADGAFSLSDPTGNPDLKDQDLKMRLPNGTVHTAHVLRFDPEGRDAVILAVEGAIDPALLKDLPPPADPEGRPEYYRLLAFREGGGTQARFQPVPADEVLPPAGRVRPFDPRLRLSIEEWCGALVLDPQGRLAGIVGRKAPLSREAVVVPVRDLVAAEPNR